MSSTIRLHDILSYVVLAILQFCRSCNTQRLDMGVHLSSHSILFRFDGLVSYDISLTLHWQIIYCTADLHIPPIFLSFLRSNGFMFFVERRLARPK